MTAKKTKSGLSSCCEPYERIVRLGGGVGLQWRKAALVLRLCGFTVYSPCVTPRSHIIVSLRLSNSRRRSYTLPSTSLTLSLSCSTTAHNSRRLRAESLVCHSQAPCTYDNPPSRSLRSPFVTHVAHPTPSHGIHATADSLSADSDSVLVSGGAAHAARQAHSPPHTPIARSRKADTCSSHPAKRYIGRSAAFSPMLCSGKPQWADAAY